MADLSGRARRQTFPALLQLPHASGSQELGVDATVRQLYDGLNNPLPFAVSDEILAPMALLSKNLLVNGSFASFQRGTLAVAADTQRIADCWRCLADGDSAFTGLQSVSSDTNGLATVPFSFGFSVTAANKKFGIVQFLPCLESRSIWGCRVSLSFTARSTVTRKLRAAILGWTGEVDNLPADIIVQWSAEGTNPILKPSLYYLNTPSDLTATTTETWFTIENVPIGLYRNIGVFIWSDETDVAASNSVRVGGVQLQKGERASVQSGIEPYLDIYRSHHFVQVLNYYDTLVNIGQGFFTSATNARLTRQLNMAMRPRATGKMTVSFTGAIGEIRAVTTNNNTGITPSAFMSPTVDYGDGQTSVPLDFSIASGGTVNHNCLFAKVGVTTVNSFALSTEI